MPEAAARTTLRSMRRRQILDAARGLVAEGGLEALTFGALERRLEFTRGVITYHFDNKDDIVGALLEEAVRDIDDAARTRLAEADDAAGRVEAVVGAMVHGFLEHVEAAAVLVSFWSRLRTDPRAAEVNASLYARYRTDSAALLREGLDSGELSSMDVEAMAAVLVGLVIGIVTQAYFEPGCIDVEASVREAGRSLRARLAG